MEYQVYPIAITKGDLTSLIHVCNRVLGYSPARGLDQSYLNSGDPAAFLSCLKLDNNPINTLRSGRQDSSIFSHFLISFLVVIDLDCLIELQNQTDLKLYSKKARSEYLTIVTGTLDVWHDALVNGAQAHQTRDLRSLMNTVQGYLERFGFKEIFTPYSKQKQQDGTFILHGNH